MSAPQVVHEPDRWIRQVPGVGTLTSEGVLRLSVACSMACGHHLIEGAELDDGATFTRQLVRNVAQAAADELGRPVLVTAAWDDRHPWRVGVCQPIR